ncbi:Glyoxalase superfamily enzyme, possibly 3-demethylubiquinone-9 3-methyltransferase [Geodermatophilus obscurus]|uniref:Glyoxalase superfamily enzyme, possibly 3-demethylubiquinone-9 3-methyltransferase n=2 Tax=Geodermatophilus obscurus TaxID=1861 RepID=A0A1I5E1V7_9ACTN|nr:Glyoxalase superfamily enzyme, possibly 3-demethylubiquinone-9 3-methyltransferase [Geodermatophilus obscurus]
MATSSLPPMPQQVTPFLMFTGDAERAMELYTSLFDDARVLALTRWGAEGQGAEGTVQQATFSIAGQVFRCFDSPPVHAFGFTPSLSLFVDVASEEELDRLFAGLSEGGEVLMPIGDYGFSRRFGWVNDRFGVSWQLNLP